MRVRESISGEMASDPHFSRENMIPQPGSGYRIIKKREYVPILTEQERAAYHAAHRVLTEQSHDPELACPGARRSRQLDEIARIIMESMPHELR